MTGASGEVISRKDFAAFGDEAVSSQRVSGLSFTSISDEVRRDYTGYQKNEESQLEYSQARYYNPSHGRFTSVDPLAASATIKNPQTLNRYSYVINNPYKFVDPLGLRLSDIGVVQTDDPWLADTLERESRNNLLGERSDPPPPPDGPPPGANCHMCFGAQSTDSSDQGTTPQNDNNLSEMVDSGGPNRVGNAEESSDKMGWPPFGYNHDGVHVVGNREGANAVMIKALQGHIVYWNVQETTREVDPVTGKSRLVSNYTVHIRTADGKFFVLLKDFSSVSPLVKKLPMGVRAINERTGEITNKAVRVKAHDILGTVTKVVGLHVGLVPLKNYSIVHNMISNKVNYPARIPYMTDPCGSGSPVRCK